MLEEYLREALKGNRKIVETVVKAMNNRYIVHYDARRAVYDVMGACGGDIQVAGQSVASLVVPPEQFVKCFNREVASTYFFGCKRRMEINVRFDGHKFIACDTKLYAPCDRLEHDIVPTQAYDFKDALTRFQTEHDLIGLRASVQSLDCQVRASEKLESTLRVIGVSIDTANRANENWETAFKRSLGNGLTLCKGGVKPEMHRIYHAIQRDKSLVVRMAKTISSEGSSICVQEVEECRLKLIQRSVRSTGEVRELVETEMYDYFDVYDDTYTGKYPCRLQSEPFAKVAKA